MINKNNKTTVGIYKGNTEIIKVLKNNAIVYQKITARQDGVYLVYRDGTVSSEQVTTTSVPDANNALGVLVVSGDKEFVAPGFHWIAKLTTAQYRAFSGRGRLPNEEEFDLIVQNMDVINKGFRACENFESLSSTQYITTYDPSGWNLTSSKNLQYMLDGGNGVIKMKKASASDQAVTMTNNNTAAFWPIYDLDDLSENDIWFQHLDYVNQTSNHTAWDVVNFGTVAGETSNQITRTVNATDSTVCDNIRIFMYSAGLLVKPVDPRRDRYCQYDGNITITDTDGVVTTKDNMWSSTGSIKMGNVEYSTYNNMIYTGAHFDLATGTTISTAGTFKTTVNFTVDHASS